MKKKVRLNTIIVSILLVIVFIVAVGIGQAFGVRKNAKKDLFDAIKNNEIHIVSEILDQYPALVDEEYFALLAPVDASNSTPLSEAIHQGHFKIVKLLVEDYQADVNKWAGSVVEYPPIIDALFAGNYEIAWYLIEHGADISVRVDDWMATVPFAILEWRVKPGEEERELAQLGLLQYVIEQGVDLSAPSSSYAGIKTLLGIAAYQNNAAVVEYLLDEQLYDIDEIINEADKKQTALIVAVKEQSYHACEVLLARGADTTIKDIDGKTAIDYAKELNDERLIAILGE